MNASSLSSSTKSSGTQSVSDNVESTTDSSRTLSHSISPDINDTPITATPPEATSKITENPFDSPESRSLFEAIDELQSCQINQHIEIPQLVIVGGQSSGKSSLVQSLTDIPLPVGSGCCTRFATRIVSKRTAANTTNQYKITIVDPEVQIPGFPYTEEDDAPYKTFEEVGETVGPDDFAEIIDEVSSNYLGIKPGTGPDKKNFATQVLRIELSGPSRSHFSILDIPGHISNPVTINENEMEGIKNMMVQYMKQPENIVICVADAVTNLERHDAVHLASQYVSNDSLVKVFTKCDGVGDKDEIVENATSSLGGGWFVVRNRHGKENRLFDLSAAEERLFNKAPWTTIPENHRGTEKLRLYLSSFLSHRIRNTFPQIQNRIQYLLNKAQADRRAIGDPRRSPKDHQQFLREIIRNYESLANKSIRRPWLLESEGMRVRGKVKALNHKFSREMHDNGHVYPFENLELDCSPEPDEQQKSRESSIVLFSEIRSQLDLFQSTQLPGLVNPEIVPVLFRKQTEQWQRLANDHLLQVAVKVAEASKEILSSVCPSSPRENSALYRQLYEALNTRFDNALRNAREDLESYCAKERFHQLQTTDTRFYTKLKAMRIVRWQRSLDAVRRKLGDQLQIDDAVALYEHLHPSADNNVICEIHDILKVYYEIAIDSFIRHVTTTIVEDFVSNSQGSLLGLSQRWVDGLNDQEVECLASEDVDTIAQRNYLDNHIRDLKNGYEICKKAWTGRSA